MDLRSPELRELLRRWEALLAFIESVSSELDLQPLLTRILANACDLVSADSGAIGLVDERRNVIRIEAVHRMPEGELGSEVPAGEGLAGHVLLTGQPLVLDRYGDVPRPVRTEMTESAEIGMPISWRGRMIGFFGIGRKPHDAAGRARPFSYTETQFLGLFARHAAIAIVNARRYAWERERAERLRLIARMGRLATADLELDEMLAKAADAIHELLLYPNIAIPLIDPEDPEILVLRTVGGHYREIISCEYRLSIHGGIMGAAVRARATQLVNDVASDPRYIPTPGSIDITSELAVPILQGGRVLGVINIESGEPFTDEDAAGLEIVADQLAVAIENARLYKRARRLAVIEERHRLARELHDSVTQQLFGIELIGRSLTKARRQHPDEAERRISRLLELSDSAVREMRQLLVELRPGSEAPVDHAPTPPSTLPPSLERLRHEGLPEALAYHIAIWDSGEPRIDLDARGYSPQPPEVEEALYRIAQEALSNAIRHSRSHRVRLRLDTADGSVRLLIQDDGRGFEPDRSPSGGLGLSTMRERAERLGGAVRLVSSPGRGTIVDVAIPNARGGGL